MELFIIAMVALVASGLTLFSGFGLGTLLMPVIAIFFPIEIAIAVTAIVHFANNIFKVGLLGKKADHAVLISFGLPAIVFAVLGALTLGLLTNVPDLFSYSAFGRQLSVTTLKFVIGVVILVFVILELSPKLSEIALAKKYLPVGGMLSGFFGGLSGHQGVFRSMFLIKAGLSKEAFVATGVMLAVMVDVARLLIYGLDVIEPTVEIDWRLVIAASLSAFAGAYIGAKLLKKVTITLVQNVVSILLILVAIGLMSGWL